MKHKFTILLTACISPQMSVGNGFSLSRIDPLIRLNDYLIAMDFWLCLSDSRITGIVFVENSGFDLSSLKQLCKNKNIYNRQIEFIQYSKGDIPFGYHYGYAEISMIDKCFLESEIIKDSLYVIKVTGRLYFPKLSKLINYVESDDMDIMIDSRDYHIFSVQRYCLTTLFIVKMEFYLNHLYDAKRFMSKSLPMIEHLYFSILMPLYRGEDKRKYLRFPINVYPKGIGAHSNNNYSSFKHILKNSLRHCSRILFPNLWI